MNKFYPLTISHIQVETRESVSISLCVPDEYKAKFHYQQGQYLVFKHVIKGQEERRSYSICSSVNDEHLKVGIKQVEGGVFSSFANQELKVGDVIDVMPPQGQFGAGLNILLDNKQPNRHVLAVAAGSGITPILSIIKTYLEQDSKGQVTLLYGNRSTASAMFRNTLEDLKNTYMDRLNLIFLFTRENQDIDLYNGRIDGAKCEQLLKRLFQVETLAAAFICGPQTMTEEVSNSLIEQGLAKENVHYELFYTDSANTLARTKRENNKVQMFEASDVTVIHDGRQMQFELPKNTKTILEAGNDIGADLPYSCTAGVCSTCRAKVIEGEVEMDVNFALEDYEVEAGYVLSCQCYPISNKVVLSYDQ